MHSTISTPSTLAEIRKPSTPSVGKDAAQLQDGVTTASLGRELASSCHAACEALPQTSVVAQPKRNAGAWRSGAVREGTRPLSCDVEADVVNATAQVSE